MWTRFGEENRNDEVILDDSLTEAQILKHETPCVGCFVLFFKIIVGWFETSSGKVGRDYVV